ncbi:Lsr2 protein [Sanguibacter gelidistatuariae]|uniref:Lsr2 protein n=1 Tax=Sanguibacter gelidistatuariae TaxID=1814289 RepID=A0A1G6RVP1_9MICO|nr:Lsr2 family protein [Sanguibacter gelidistatuariae]SDD08712.1 Lsr2 protein [Sanguibacter gelidistatuariae]
MAVQTKIILLDDVDGGPATESIVFGLDGITYEIDLNDDHGAQLRAVLERLVGSARRVSDLGSSATFTRVVTDYDPRALRAWASAHQITVPARGRIPADVVAQYRAAGN